MSAEPLFRRDRPAIATRGVHLDLKGVPPTFERLIGLLDVFAAGRYNAVLVEWEDMFPWTVDERFRCETAYTPEQVRAFAAAAAERDIEIIPLVQCLGHMETPLSVPGYEHLRERPDDPSALNPLADGARRLVQDMVDDVLALLPDVRRFHLGGDEAWTFGTHPDTKAHVDAHGKGALYMQHVGPILDGLDARNIRPILWHDMMIHWESAALTDLAGKADLCVWGYHEHPDTTGGHFNRKHIERLAAHGMALWGGTAYKGADGHDVDLPDLAARQRNALAWAEVARRYEMKGVFATAWSRYSTHSVQCEPIDAALDSLINVGVILHDGEPPAGGVQACVAEALAPIGERARFEACKAAMARLAELRYRGWRAVRFGREQVICLEQDPRRAHGGRRTLQDLRDALAKADEVAGEVVAAFEGLMPRIWTDRYLAERLTPLTEELAELAQRKTRGPGQG